MPADRRRILRGICSVLLLASGILVAVSIDHGLTEQTEPIVSPKILDAPRFSIRLGRNHLVLAGTTSTQQHESALMQIVDDRFASYDTQTEFSPGLFVPQEWDSLTARLLYLVASTESASAAVSDKGIEIRGVTFAERTYKHRLEFLQEALPAGATINSDVIPIRRNITLGGMCRVVFSSFADQVVGLDQATDEIRLASYPLLDRLIEFAYDCRDSSIAIIGYSDTFGTESRNMQLSLQRAQAVADYLIRAGVTSERLIVEGLGSNNPVADNNTAHGRELNRRIEFELR